MELNEALLGRRSVYPRQFSGEDIPEVALWKALEAANWAPAHKKTHPWRFLVFRGAGKNRLIDFWIHMAQKNAAVAGETWDDVKQQKFELMRQSSAIIGLACHYSGMVPEIEETCACAAAVQNLWLSLHDQGYGGYWSTGNGAFSSDVHQFLGLADNEKCLGYFMAGTLNGAIPPSFRKPISDFVKFVNE